MPLANIASTNLNYNDDPRNLIITNDVATGDIIFTSEKHNISPKVLGTLVAEEAASSTDERPRIRIYLTDAEGQELRTIIRRKPAYFIFCATEGSQGPQRVSTADNRADMITETLTYLNSIFNETQAVTSTTIEFGPDDTIDAKRDFTNTTVLFDNGSAHSVNSIKATINANGNIDIVSIDDSGTNVYMSEIRNDKVYINGSLLSTSTQAVVNELNALFTVNPIGLGGTDPEPVFPTLDGVSIVGNTWEMYDPIGDAIYAPNTSAYGRYWSTETIDQPGEHYTVKWHGEGQIMLGLYSVNDGDLAELQTNGDIAGSAGIKWAHALYDYGDYMGPWTVYGSSPGFVYGSGWIGNNENLLRYKTAIQDGLKIGQPVLMKVGIDDNGYAYVSYFDEGVTNDYILLARTSYILPDDDQYGLVLKLKGQSGGISLHEEALRVAVDPVAPTLYYRYIESPDGSFHYPLFSTEEEANHYDLENGGSGTSHTHVYVDEPTYTNWYMPDNGSLMAVSSAPSNTSEITYTEIPTDADSNYVPPQYSNTQVVNENTSVNIQVNPQGSNWTTTVTGLPSPLTFNGVDLIQGVTPYVPEDTSYTVTVIRTNAFGSSTGTLNLSIQDNVSLGDFTGFTEVYGNFVQPNRMVLDFDALVQYDTVLSQGQEMTYSYTQIPPTIGILNTTGQDRVDDFDPAVHTLGQGDHNFAETGKWALRYVSFGGYVGATSTKYALVGWDDNTILPASEGTNVNVEFKLEYANDGYIRLYRNGVLLKTSASTFTGDQTITMAAFDDQAQTDVYIPANLTIATTGAGSTTPPVGFVDPLLEGQMDSTSLVGSDSAVQLTQQLKLNHRYIFPRTWVEANVLPHIGDLNNEVFIGVPNASADWTDVGMSDFDVMFRLKGNGDGSHVSHLRHDTGSSFSQTTVTINSMTNAFYDYALEWDGEDLHIIACNLGDINTQPGINDGGSFSRVTTYSGYGTATGTTGQNLDIVIATDNDAQVNLTTSGLQQIRIPFGARTILVGESSNGNGQFGEVSSEYFDLGGQHAPGIMTFAAPTVNAGYTYNFIYHPSMESTDFIEFRLASDSTTVYNTGVTTFDNTVAGDPAYTDSYKGVTFAIPTDAPPLKIYYYNSYQSGYYDAGRELPISGSTYTAPVTGVTIEGPSANFTGNVINSGSNGWLSLNETLSAGERLVLDSAFLQDLNDALPDYCIFWVGLKSDAWANTDFPLSSFKGGCALRFYNTSDTGNSEPGLRILGYANNSLTSQLYTASLAQASAFLEITNSGNNIRVGYEATSDATLNAASTPYSDWEISAKAQTGDQGYGITSAEVGIYWVAISGNDTGFDITQVDWTGLTEVGVPAAPTTLLTDWNKALDFSGSAERALQVDSGNSFQALKMGGVNNNVAAPTFVGYTSADSNARPWATACVFQVDGNSSNQHIWNLGEGSGSTDDNIYLRLDASRNLYFGWGRTGSLNECQIAFNISTTQWYGVYIAHTGERLGDGHAAGDIADCFDIRVFSSGTNWQLASAQNASTYANWSSLNSSFGARMNRQFTGSFSIGGRDSNRSFHGKIASMVTTTLRLDQPMPSDDEVRKMVIDPRQWLLDYKIGQLYRLPASTSNFTFQMFDSGSAYGTQVWLMGDGPYDAYAQIRNHVHPTIQNIYPLNMISMVSNDIQNVTIPGLT